MKHLGTRTIETERLILRRFIFDDGEAMFNNWAKDEEVTKYLMWPPHNTVDISQAYILTLIDGYEQDTTYDWGIELKEIGQVIGSIGVVRSDEQVGSLHIGYCIGKKWWNQGLMSEAFSAIIRYLFEEVGANRIESRFDPRNVGSGKVMEKCGLQYEGTLRESDHNNQGICDAAYYGLLRKDVEQWKNQ